MATRCNMPHSANDVHFVMEQNKHSTRFRVRMSVPDPLRICVLLCPFRLLVVFDVTSGLTKKKPRCKWTNDGKTMQFEYHSTLYIAVCLYARVVSGHSMLAASWLRGCISCAHACVFVDDSRCLRCRCRCRSAHSTLNTAQSGFVQRWWKKKKKMFHFSFRGICRLGSKLRNAMISQKRRCDNDGDNGDIVHCAIFSAAAVRAAAFSARLQIILNHKYP